MTIQLMRPDGTISRTPLGPVLGQGSYGVIRLATDCPELAVKIYRHTLASHNPRRRQYLERKLQAMLHSPPPTGDEHITILWPTAIAYTPEGTLAGYAMHRLPDCFKPLKAHPPAPWHPAAATVIERVRQTLPLLHRHEFVIGDISPTNILTDPTGTRISLADTDSWQFRDRTTGRRYLAESYTMPFVAAELKPPPGNAPSRPNCTNPECPQAGLIHQQKPYQCVPRRPRHDLAAWTYWLTGVRPSPAAPADRRSNS